MDDTIERIFRIYISSSTRLLKNERKILSEEILRNGHLPIQMEYNFVSDESNYSLEIDENKIKNSDCVIFIFSYMYGEIIDKKNRHQNKECCLYFDNIEECNECFGDGCHLSFTHYEYLYAKKLNKPCCIIRNHKYNDVTTFEKVCDYEDETDKAQLRAEFYKYKDQNNQFIREASQVQVFEYNNGSDNFSSVCSSAVRQAIKLASNVPDAGMVNYSSQIKYLEDLNSLRKSGIYKVFSNQSETISWLNSLPDNELFTNDEIKILAIRGISFTNQGKEWGNFTWRKPYNKYPIEFVLADYRNEKIIEKRYKAFANNPDDSEEYEDFKSTYKTEMQMLQNKVKERKNAKLYLHSLDKLPFRMIFIGNYLFLSSFVSNKKAENSLVITLKKGTELYHTCREYYDWVKEQSMYES
jgi:hypothetical protein